ncbi:polysaccharide deacetylase family protein [Evansella tamaricis]|uniref:Polysaccharide deacetylase family protein n=1 Tax=Evansella tamaricis TaxID=2069301 RepID=A0ABS6JJ64_9BACI|nr:polysaccharide deacetylase family protein [Evansella tamaricis]MBU9712490.1 polysaccharide deacetylase family protein [Evansella tamaricis]
MKQKRNRKSSKKWISLIVVLLSVLTVYIQLFMDQKAMSMEDKPIHGADLFSITYEKEMKELKMNSQRIIDLVEDQAKREIVPDNSLKGETVVTEQKITEKEESILAKDDIETNKEEKKQLTPPSNNGTTVYLTFDDGPSLSTDSILQSLGDYGATATFFMLEPNMRKFPNQLKATIKEGHVPALHGVTHDKRKFYKSDQSPLLEMKQTQDTLVELTGITTNLIRTPYGSTPHLTSSQKKVLFDAGFLRWDWTVDSEDWKYTNGEYVRKVMKDIRKVHEANKPIIILLHDRQTTADYLQELLDNLHKEGYNLKGLDESLLPHHF